MEPILIKYNEANHRYFIGKAKDCLKFVQEYFERFKEVLPVKIGPEIFKDILQNSEPELTVNAIKQAITDQLAKAGIRSKGIKESAINEDLEAFYTVFNEFARKKGYNERENFFKYFYCKDGCVFLIEGFEEMSKDMFCQYVRTPEEKALREAHVKAFEAVRDFTNLLPQSLRFNLKQYFGLSPETMEYVMHSLDYERVLTQ